MTTKDRAKQLATHKRYRDSAKGKATKARYEASAKRKKWKLRYRKSAHGKAIQLKSQRSPKARVRRRLYRHSPEGKASAYRYRHSTKGKAKLAKAQRAQFKRLRQEILVLLGNACKRCGFDDARALQIDHIRGGGALEKKKIGTHTMYRKIIRDGGIGYQILCANCNWIKRAEIEEEHDTRKHVKSS